MALLTANGDPDEPANSYVFWAIASAIVLMVVVGLVIGATRIL
jgi:hypothetical protein